ncbi:MAG: FAD/NAD(P)-binding oxidoreductase [Pyrinomonadaceae bacterium]
MCEPMNDRRESCDVLVVGGGPAGLAAACGAAESGRRVIIVDDNLGLGGQIWRGEAAASVSSEASVWLAKARRADVRFIGGASVYDCSAGNKLWAETSAGVCQFAYRKLILATGARELLLPFPGWTLPRVMGAGGLQALVKSGLSVAGKRIVVAGSGPLLLAVAATLRRRKAHVVIIAEQASRRSLLKFGLSLAGQVGKVYQAISIKSQLIGVPYLSGCWPVAAEGDDRLRSVTLRQGEREWRVACDYLACGFHLLPNLELAQLCGCQIVRGAVRIDDFQETSGAGVSSAGEATGIGGLELSLIEGEIAGLAAAGNAGRARRLFHTRERHRRFAAALNSAFAVRDELRALPTSEPSSAVAKMSPALNCRPTILGAARSCKLVAEWGRVRAACAARRFVSCAGGSRIRFARRSFPSPSKAWRRLLPRFPRRVNPDDAMEGRDARADHLL